MDEEYLEAVLDTVARIPPGRASTYGVIAELVADELESRDGRRRGGPRQVGRVMALAGSGVPWWRVVNAVGRPPQRHDESALAHLRAEGTPLTAGGDRVDLRRAGWPD